MQYSDDEKRLLVWRVCNQEISDGLESQRPGGEIGSLMALMWEWHEPANGPEDFFTHTLRR